LLQLENLPKVSVIMISKLFSVLLSSQKIEGIWTKVPVTLVLMSICWAGLAQAQSTPPATPPAHWGPVSINLEDVPYPHPVNFLNRNLYGQDVRIAYMDVPPVGRSNGRTVVMLHGGSYYGWYWEDSIKELTNVGYRVITVDRLGWGRSSKPIIPYSAALHSANTLAILEHLGIDKAAIVGHSMGGKLASTFAYTYPEVATHLVMVNPIGIGNPTSGRPWREATSGDTNPDLQQVYERHLGTEVRRIAEWKPEHLEHVRIRYGHALSAEYPRLNLVRSLNSGITSDPIAFFWPKIQTRAMLIGGAQDGPNLPEISRAATDLLPNGEHFMIEEAGHNPHLETPEILNRELIRFLSEGT
jgi:pimeloyl-ACP methyl ester carboxylesterase